MSMGRLTGGGQANSTGVPPDHKVNKPEELTYDKTLGSHVMMKTIEPF
jgi:hypothetical protein